MGGWQGGEERWRVQTARPLKGRCGWQRLTLVTMGFHQRLLMKADCQGIVREPKGWRGERGGGRERGEGERKGLRRDSGNCSTCGLRPCSLVMSGCSGEEERCLWTLWW